MKKCALYLYLVLILSSNSFSQSGWFWQNPLPSSNIIVKVKFLNSNFGMGVGDFGTVIKTTNGGNLWFTLQNLTPNNLKNLCILDSSIIFVVGSEGNIFKTTNSGSNWNRIEVGLNSQWNDIVFLDSKVGFIAGQGRVMKTTNAGLNWNVSVLDAEINSINFINFNNGFIAGYNNKFYKTTNGGINWNLINPEIFGDWYSVYFKDENNGLLFGRKILKSTNGGLNWSQSVANTNEYTFTCEPIDSNNILAGGGDGLLLKSSNFGLDWNTIPSSLSGKIVSSIKYFNDTSIIAHAWYPCYPCQFDIVKSFNGGMTWNSQLQGNRDVLKSIEFTDVNTGIAVGGNGIILRTVNGGINWTMVPAGGNSVFTDIQLFENGMGYICTDKSEFIKTTDFGLTWLRNYLPFSGNYTALSFINENTGFVSGYHFSGTCFPRVLKTTDGGNNWQNLNAGILNECGLFNIQMIDELNAYIIGYHVYKTTNGGDNWSLIFTSPYQKRAIFFHNPNTGFIADVNTLFHTINGGQNWTSFEPGTHINSIKFLNKNTGWTVGYHYTNTQVLKTINGGLNWNVFNGITAQPLFDIAILNENILFAAGESGTILKSTNGGGTLISISDPAINVPSVFHLLQNYPNPFNPITKIKFGISKSSKIRIVIYDNLGKKVEELVNDFRNSGFYELEWNAKNFPSGVYFYRMEVNGNVIDTKRMILLK